MKRQHRDVVRAICKRADTDVHVPISDVVLFVDTSRDARHVIIFDCLCGEANGQAVNDRQAAELLRLDVRRFALPAELREQHSDEPLTLREAAEFVLELWRPEVG